MEEVSKKTAKRRTWLAWNDTYEVSTFRCAVCRRRRNRSRTGSILYHSERSMYVKKNNVKQNTRWFFFKAYAGVQRLLIRPGKKKTTEEREREDQKGETERWEKQSGKLVTLTLLTLIILEPHASGINILTLYPVKAHSQPRDSSRGPGFNYFYYTIMNTS